MPHRKVTAIIRSDALEKVESRLQEFGVRGISVSRVKGYGEYANFYARDWLTSHARIEIFTAAEHAEQIVAAIIDAAHVGQAGALMHLRRWNPGSRNSGCGASV